MLITNGKQNGNRMMKKKLYFDRHKTPNQFFHLLFHHPNLPIVSFSSDRQNDGEEMESPVKHLIEN